MNRMDRRTFFLCSASLASLAVAKTGVLSASPDEVDHRRRFITEANRQWAASAEEQPRFRPQGLPHGPPIFALQVP